MPWPTGASRVITLAPSLTEVAFAIGCGSEVVADTTYDRYPPAARALPHVADLIHADLERIAALSPTAILALHDQEPEGAAISARLRMAVTYLPNRNLPDLFTVVRGVGAACRREADARSLAQALHQRIDALTASAAQARSRPRVLYLLGLPGFVVGGRSYINDLLVDAGAINVTGNIDQAYPNVNAEQIVLLNPDVVIVSNSVAFGPDVRAQEPWRALRAVRDGRVLRPPTDDVIERNGPRVVKGLAWLVRALH